MPWPLSQDYNEAIQDPGTCFSDLDLLQGQVAVNALGLPMPCSGNFADVYHIDSPSGAWAVKCFTRQVPDLRERYAAIGEHLQQAGMGFMVDFQYLAEGIRILEHWYPVVKMRWVEGQLLNQFVRDSLDNPSVLVALAEIWRRMALRLRESGIAHGDLQHGNVILMPEADSVSYAVTLIDYDGMLVPALAGVKPGEVGHPNYQHPQRLREGTYDPEVDRFPLLVVATALRALTVAGRHLWKRYDNGDNLLFKEADFASPYQSPLFDELLKLKDPGARSLAVRLMAAAQHPPERTPLLDEVFSAKPDPPPVPAPLPAAVGTVASALPVQPLRDAYPFALAEEIPTSGNGNPQRRMKSVLPLVLAGIVFAASLIGGIVLSAALSVPRRPSPQAEANKSRSEPRSIGALDTSKKKGLDAGPRPEPDKSTLPALPPLQELVPPAERRQIPAPQLPPLPGEDKPPVALPPPPFPEVPPPAQRPNPQEEQPKPDSLIDPLVAALKSRQASERIGALEELAKKGNRARGAARAVCEVLAWDEGPLVRKAALVTLEAIYPEVYKPVVVLALDPDVTKQADAAQEIGQLGAQGQAAVPPLCVHLMLAVGEARKPNPSTVVPAALLDGAMRALVAIAPADVQVHKALIEMTRVEAPGPKRGLDALAPTRQLAARLLGELVKKHPRQAKIVLPHLIASARLMGPLETRAQVASILGTMAEDHPDLRPQLAAALTDLVKAEELAAITALGKCGRDARDALPMLKDLKLHRLEAVRHAATEAVSQIENVGS